MQQDTVHLLQDCSAGITMALATIDGILPNVKDQTLRKKLKRQRFHPPPHPRGNPRHARPLWAARTRRPAPWPRA